MSKLALYIIFLLLINSCFAQSRRYVSKGYSIEHCTESIGIATKDTLSALWNFKTKKLIGELDASLFQFYPRTKCLLKITQDDSIYCYNLRFESPKLMFSGYQEVLVDVLTDFLVIYKGEMFDLGSEVHAINDQQSMIISGAFGVELIEESAIIVDYKNRMQRGTVPLVDEFGNPILYVDSVTGLQYFTYADPDIADRGYTNGGVRHRITKDWIIRPHAKWVVKGCSTYITERIEYFFDSMNEFDKRLYTIFDHDGEILHQDLSESQLLNTPEYLNLLVPKFRSDSILESSEIRTLLFHDDYDFLSGGKMGRFRLATNEILQKPVDFLQWTSPIDEEVHTIVENDSITFQIMDRTESYSMSKGDKFEFYSVLGGGIASITFRVKNAVFDSVFTYQFRFSNGIDTSLRTDFASSDLKSALEQNLKNGTVRINQLWQYSIERISKDQIIVTNNKAKFFGDEARLASGVFSLRDHKWIVQPHYHSIVEFQTGFKAYQQDPSKNAEPKFDLYDVDGKLVR